MPRSSRDKEVVKVSIIGIIANLILTALKAIAGFIAGSIAVVLDALNSLTDAFASVATIIGEKISNRDPSRKHPFGYGRVEYVTSIIIAAIIIAAGIISLRESILKIIHPSEPDYSMMTLIILIVSTLAKIFLGLYFMKHGKSIDSQPVKASGIDALYDAILTFGTLLAALICMIWHIDLDGWIGAVISLFVIKAGIDVLREATDSIIGNRPDEDKSKAIRSLIAGHDSVSGVYDLMIDSFGPEHLLVTCRIEVPEDMPASEIHEITRHISEELSESFNAQAVLGVYATNSNDDFAGMHKKLDELVEDHPEILQVHGFYVDVALKQVSFDLVIDFDQDADAIAASIAKQMSQLYPDFTFNVIADLDYS